MCRGMFAWIQFSWRPEGDLGSPGDGVTSSREVPLWCWELNLGPLEEYPVPLTSESSLQPFILMLAVFPSFEISTES